MPLSCLIFLIWIFFYFLWFVLIKTFDINFFDVNWTQKKTINKCSGMEIIYCLFIEITFEAATIKKMSKIWNDKIFWKTISTSIKTINAFFVFLITQKIYIRNRVFTQVDIEEQLWLVNWKLPHDFKCCLAVIYMEFFFNWTGQDFEA